MKQLYKRILSALLAIVLFVSDFPVITRADAVFAITHEGEAVTQVEFYENEKIFVTTENMPDACSHQWQIQIPGTDQWVDIYGQAEAELGLSKAVVGSLLVDGSAYVRCAAVYNGEKIAFTEPLCTIVKDMEVVFLDPLAFLDEEAEEPTEVTESVTEETEPVTEATEVPTEATEPVTEATEAPTEATEPATEATEAPTEATEPATEATEAPTEATEPATEATEAPTEATEPVTEATESVTEATQAPTEATEVSSESAAFMTELPAVSEDVMYSAVTETAELLSAEQPKYKVMKLSAVTEETAYPAETEPFAEAPAALDALAEAFAAVAGAEAVAEIPPETVLPEEVPADVPEIQETVAETTAPTEAPVAVSTETEFVVRDDIQQAEVDEAAEDGTEVDIAKIAIHYRAVDRYGKFISKKTDASDINNAAEEDPFVTSDVVDVIKGSVDHITFTCHVMPGYKLQIPEYHDGQGLTVSGNTVVLDMTKVTGDVTFYVYYVETMVPYKARYFMQNVYNDLHTEATDILTDEQKALLMGYPGDMPATNLIYPIYPGTADRPANEKVKGFSPLFYQPDEIASDGSTVFEVYYDRNYYLMNFNMDGGFGTAPVYARYETAFTVADPTKAGHSFLNWELDKVNGVAATDAQKAEAFPTKIPAENRTYLAKWKKEQTSYKVAYWVLSKNGTEKSYIGGTKLYKNSGEYVDGSDSLTGTPVCGEHGHTNECISCKHWHTASCYAYLSAQNEAYAPEEKVVLALGAGEPEAGFIYTAEYTGYDRIWYMVNCGDRWHCWHKPKNEAESMVSGSVLRTGVYEDTDGTIYTVRKYNAVFSGCTKNHTHSATCVRSCQPSKHVHTTNCYQNTQNLVYVDSVTYENNGNQITFKTDKGIQVAGDGSTVVNVYYEYREYDLIFYYARTKGGVGRDKNNDHKLDDDFDRTTFSSIQVVGGTTDPFCSSTWSTNDETLLRAVTEWGDVQSFPILTRNPGYGTGFLPAADGYDYHYITFKARYNDDISVNWPCDVFAPVLRTDDSMEGQTYWTGNVATASGWSGERYVAYNDNSNRTIKGIYDKLDDAIVYKSDYATQTAGETSISYLCFWENGYKKDWSVPELYVYRIWLPCTKEAYDNETDDTKKREKNGQYYRLYKKAYTCDNSNINEQTGMAIEGYEENVALRDFGMYFITGARKDTENGPYYVISNGKNEDKYYNNTVNCGKTYTVNDGDIAVDSYTVTENGQDETRYTVYTTKGEYEYDPNNLKDPKIDHSQYREAYAVNFYYKAKTYQLYFWNYNGYLEDGSGASDQEGGEKGVPYGTPISLFKNYVTNPEYIKRKYPKDLEPDVYEFKGWYTADHFTEETEVNWETLKMPDSDMTLYARWEPIKHTVYFYMDQERYEKATPEVYKTVADVPHGTSILTADLSWIDSMLYVDKDGTKYTRDEVGLVNWFYLDVDGTKKAFNPYEMAVRRELHLFAEWSSSDVKEYTVKYRVGEIQPDKSVKPVDPAFYMANNETGYGLLASTKTLKALPMSQLTNFPDDADGNSTANKLWLPHTNSHSIIMQKKNENNICEFYYVMKEKAPYKVRYLNAADNKPMEVDGEGNEVCKVCPDNTSPVVVENFKYFEGYIADAFHKQLVLSANDEENVITFLYTKVSPDDSGSGSGGTPPKKDPGLYLIAHHYPELDGINEQVDYVEGIGEIGTIATVNPSNTLGFTFDSDKTIAEYATRFGVTQAEAAEKVKQVDGKWEISGTIKSGKDTTVNKALELHLYYSRNTVKYTVEHRNSETNELIKVKNELGVDVEQTFEDEGLFEQEITAESKTFVGYDVDAPDKDGKKKLSIELSWDEDTNVITFTYTPKKLDIEYKTVCNVEGLTDFGAVTNPRDYNKTTPVGSQAYAAKGSRFVGWYEDWETENPQLLTTNASFLPEVDTSTGIFEYTYYAVFEPVIMTIHMTNGNTGRGVYEVVSADGNTLYNTVTLGHNETVTILQVPAGAKVRAKTGWDWAYNSQISETSVDANGNMSVEITRTDTGSCWLHDG